MRHALPSVTLVSPCRALGQLPLLEIDGMKLTQSIALVLYCAKRCGLYPRSDRDIALALAAYGCSKDFARPLLGRPFDLVDGVSVEECDG